MCIVSYMYVYQTLKKMKKSKFKHQNGYIIKFDDAIKNLELFNKEMNQENYDSIVSKIKS
ncbi:cbb3-type cytochrome oxidase subunit 3 [Flammeovirga yaeyamensis]|nr:cbb3-type cytochrome oxidase subunit 3 [Flammeovirga yaeyamensis]